MLVNLLNGEQSETRPFLLFLIIERVYKKNETL